MALPTAPFNAAKSIFAGKSVIQLKIAPALTGVTAATDTITTGAAHGLSVGQQVIFNSGTGFTGLVGGTAYFVVLVPTATTFKISATSGGAALTPGTSSAGSFQPVQIIESRLLKHGDDAEYKEIQRPDSSGILRTVRKVKTKGGETWKFEMDEAKRIVDVFSGALAGFVTATATLWLPDPQDASGYVALKSETDFTCTIGRDGELGFGDSDFTKATLMLTSTKQGPVLFTADATA